MSNPPAKVEIPPELYDIAEEKGLTPSKLLAKAEVLFPDVQLTRVICREVIAKVHEENRLDHVAANPSDISSIEKMANQGLYNELALLLEDQNLCMAAKAEMTPGKKVVLPGMADCEALGVDEVDDRLRAIGNRIQKISSALANLKPPEGSGVNVNVNLNTMVNDALGRLHDDIDVKAQ